MVKNKIYEVTHYTVFSILRLVTLSHVSTLFSWHYSQYISIWFRPFWTRSQVSYYTIQQVKLYVCVYAVCSGINSLTCIAAVILYKPLFNLEICGRIVILLFTVEFDNGHNMVLLYLQMYIERHLYSELCSFKHINRKHVNGIYIVFKCFHYYFQNFTGLFFLVYCTYKSIVTKLISLRMSQWTQTEITYLSV